MLVEELGAPRPRACTPTTKMRQEPAQCGGDVAEPDRQQGRAYGLPDERHDTPRLRYDTLL